MNKDAAEKAKDPMAWFQHDANAAHDSKCQRLIYRYGNAGYGAYWRLCEYLAAEKGHAISVETDEDWLILATNLGLRREGAFDEMGAAESCKTYIDCLLEIGLIERDGKGHIESARMQRNAMFFGQQRANGAKGGRPRKQRPEE